MSEKLEVFDRYLISQESRLEAGEVLSVRLMDGVLTIYKEVDETGRKRNLTLIDRFDAQLNLSVDDLVSMQKGSEIL